MSQNITVMKNADQMAESLWWKPFFTMQQQLNQAMRALCSDTSASIFLTPAWWDLEEDMIAAYQRNSHRVFSELFNHNQHTVSMLTGLAAEPNIDILESGAAFKIMVDVPGMEAKDLDVSVAENAITVSGSHAKSDSQQEDAYLHRECHTDHFSRTIAMPEEADVGKASACLEQSVLTVVIPKKSEAAMQRKVQIETAQTPVKKPNGAGKPVARRHPKQQEERSTELNA